MDEILYLFHHIHHQNGGHIVHHCGGDHKKIDPCLDYTITHCPCRKHTIDKPRAFGHTINSNLQKQEIMINFVEKCPYGGWHVESGVVLNKNKK